MRHLKILMILTILFSLATVPVMAHQPPAGQTFAESHDGVRNNDGQTADQLAAETGHSHYATAPMVESITAVDTMGQVAPAETDGTLVSNVDGMNIVLVSDVTADDNTRTVIAFTDEDSDPATPDTLGAGGFILKITFDRDVYTAAGADANTAPALVVDDIIPGDITLIVAAADNPKQNIGTGASGTLFSITGVTRVDNTPDDATDSDFSKREFLVTVAVTTGITKPQAPLSIWVNVVGDTVFSPTQLEGPITIQGRGNAKYPAQGESPTLFMLDGYVAPDATPVDPIVDTEGPDIKQEITVEKTTDGNLLFEVTFDETLGLGGILPSHLEITGGTLVPGTRAAPNPKEKPGNVDDAAHTYQILVTPDGDVDNTEVTLKIRDGSVADLEGNYYQEPVTVAQIGRWDTVNPTVHPTAGGPPAPVPAGAVTLQITFSEPLGPNTKPDPDNPESEIVVGYDFTNADIDRTNSNVLLTHTPPMKAADQPEDGTEVWELTVTPVPADADQVIIVIKESSVADIKGNMLEQDTIVTWTRPSVTPPIPDTTKTVVTVALADGMTYIDSVGGGSVMIAATDNVAVTDVVMDAEITVTNGSKGMLSDNMIEVTPNVAATTVTVSVAAGAAMDAAGNGSAAVSETFNVGPIFTVPAGAGIDNPGYFVITKDQGPTSRYLTDQPTIHTSPEQTNPPIPAPNIMTGVWSNMPDLERLFDTGSGNGGTLNIKAAATNGTAGTSGVKITEVMWAIDEFKRGAADDEEAGDQWVEIENPNEHAVQVIIYARTGLDSAVNTTDGQIDRIGNAYDGSPGSAAWALGNRGQNGNSFTGVDFVSMWRRYNDNKRANGYANGTSSGAWSASSTIYLTQLTENKDNLYNRRGTPGRLQSVDLPNPNTRVKDTTDVPSSPFIINEVANRSNADAAYEWIEIKNVTGSPQNFRRYRISMVTGVGTDTPLIDIDNKDYWVDGGDVLLLLATNPRYDDDHPIAVGYNVDVNENDQVDGLGLIVEGSNRKPPRQKVVQFQHGGLPDDGNFILLLRRPDNAGKGDIAETANNDGKTDNDDLDKIVDMAGFHGSLYKNNHPATTLPPNLNETHFWPLQKFDGNNKPLEIDQNNRTNRLAVNKVRYRQHVTTKRNNSGDKDGPVNRAGTGFIHHDKGTGHYAFRDAIYTGLGYKRTARAPSIYNGTPGYDGNSVGNTGIVKGNATSATVTISEIMYSTGTNENLPQWIELYNSSMTDAVNLRNWKLRFEMLDENGDPMDSLIDLHFNSSRSVKTIQPQQTVLIVAGSARQANSDSKTGIDVFNENRVFNVQRDVGLGKFGANTRYQFFNPKAFHLALLDKDNRVVDQIGNLDGDPRTSDTPLKDMDGNDWLYPDGVDAEGNRTSLLRIYDNRVARIGVVAKDATTGDIINSVVPIGSKATVNDTTYTWIPAVNLDIQHKLTIRSTWYGDEDDYGTPNNRKGMVLPVELSFFRPTLEDGVVTVRWTTESELDNAGFNILRSDTRNGEYTQVNAEMIQGAGTTGERSNYKWVDPTAKPGVVYYYQIEDVSFAGERQALAITKLKGLISAENKLTTTWSELKDLR